MYLQLHIPMCTVYLISPVSVPFQSALGWDYQSQLSKHESQTDAVKGFGGKFGVQKDRQDQVKFLKPQLKCVLTSICHRLLVAMTTCRT